MAGHEKTDGDPTVSITWDELLFRAEAALDEAGLEKVVKRKAVAEKIRRRMEARGQAEFVDEGSMKRALCAYWADATYGGRMKGWRKVFAESGAKAGDFLGGATDRFPDLNTAFRYIQGLIGSMAREDAAETVALAQAGQRRLLTEDGCELNQRAVEVSLKATMKDVYGDGEKDGDAKRKPIVYKFENLSVNMIMSPAELAAKRLDGATPVSEVIDV